MLENTQSKNAFEEAPLPNDALRLDAKNMSSPPRISASVTIEAGRANRDYWRGLWKYRDLLVYLAWRDVTVKYKQTFVGFAWHFLRPLITIVVFTVVFSNLAKLPSNGVPYPLLVFAALLPWQFFSTAVTECSGSIVNNSGIISKLYFPRLLLPASAILVAFADLVVALGILFVAMLVFQYQPTWRLLTLPIFTLLAVGAAMGAGLWFAALIVRYRDFRYIVSYGLQMGLYISPIGFSSSIVPEQWRMLYSLNPMVGVVDGFRWAVLGSETQLHPTGLALSIGLVITMLISGIWFFKRSERTFADHI